ncbi:MAG: peptide chain release factor 3 [Deltaproteobacteria bacterium]|nr:peptide chain release factor 3 [Deltaproteobacteria bacterium]
MSSDAGLDGRTPRRTFAIISHPDAGKTTLTEKLLLYGGAIHLAGSVRAARARRHATSDWMELEKQRGISITSSVLQFPYEGTRFNLLDTPGHQDFSEDTYRTLTAADSAVMLLDAAKGVEAQTRKLFEVCRLRKVPIATFINKLDRPGRDPFELLSEVENVLGIRCVPLQWPLGMGPDFKGVYERETGRVLLFTRAHDHGESAVAARALPLEDPQLPELVGEGLYRMFRDEVELLEGAGDSFSVEAFRAGAQTPVFFGSAMTNFGVEPFLRRFHRLAPEPLPRAGSRGLIATTDPAFTAFIFKVQANMDRAHRDRVAFLRVCSGRFQGGMWVRHVRLGREVRLSRPQQVFAQERTLVDEAWPGDVLGIFDPGMFRIGDTLCTGEPFEFDAVPRFSPEHFARLRPKDPSRRKQFVAGVSQLVEEGAVQLFTQPGNEQVPIVGVVGQLQFEVLEHRLKDEYGSEVLLETLPYSHARWVTGDGATLDALEGRGYGAGVLDRDKRLVVLFKSEWQLGVAERDNPKVTFQAIAPR